MVNSSEENVAIPEEQERNNAQLDLPLRTAAGLDTGWAWVVCFASFCMLFLTGGQHNCSGIIFVALLDKYQLSRSETAWVTSIAASLFHTFGILGTYLCQRFSCRVVATLSGIISAIALLVSAYSPSLYLLYFTYGVGFGLGSSLCCSSVLVILPKYFKERFAFAMSLGQLGVPVGTLILGPLLQHLFNTIGWSYTLIVLAGLQGFIVIAGLSFRPVHHSAGAPGNEEHVASRRTIDFSLLRYKRFILWLLCLGMFIPALLIPYVHLVRLAEDKGIGKSKASFLLYFMAVSSVITRPIVGHVSDVWPNRRLMNFQVAFFVFSVANFLAPLATGFAALATYSTAFGIFEGIWWCLLYVITHDIVGIERLTSAIGWLLFILSFPEVGGPPLAGWIYDVSRSYAVAFYVCGGMVALSACLMFSLYPVRNCFSCKIGSNRVNPALDPN